MNAKPAIDNMLNRELLKEIQPFRGYASLCFCMS